MTKNKKLVLISGLILLIVILITGLQHHIKSPGQQPGTSSMHRLPLRLNVYQIDKGWGYEVLVDTTVFIFQETIPGIQGKKIFQSKHDATKCGQLLINKMEARKHLSISKHELDSLAIVY
jgi:hypothetical protein